MQKYISRNHFDILYAFFNVSSKVNKLNQYTKI